MELKEWISLNRLDATINSNVCSINGKKLLILEKGEDELVFDTDLDLILNDHEQAILMQGGIDHVLFEFGSNWYYSDIDEIKLNIFKYIGKEKSEIEFEFPYLGIHGEYDLCNGSRLYKDWCKKAKFLNSPSLAICENNTLAGTLSFQSACKDAGIKSILGETISVAVNEEKLEMYNVKLYVKDYQGWINLLNINAQIKVFNDGFVLENYLLSNSEGLICVLSGKVNHKRILLYDKVFDRDLYFQIDFVEWQSFDKEKEYLENLKIYLDSYTELIRPVLICDSFYLDKSEGHIKKVLNSIGKVPYQNQSKDQYFKSLIDIHKQINELSPSEEWFDNIFYTAIENVTEIDSKCNFQIKLGELHLPAYEMTAKEKNQFETNEDLFYHLINKGFEEKSKYFVTDQEIYLKRIETEVEVIKSGDLIDYFLILTDIINWCKENNILTGVGRGSAAGSLVAYLVDIVQIDPLQYNLLFERFLNAGRIGKSLPDIDTDFDSERRDDVKRYMESRYGIDYVTSIGTYGTLKIKSGLSDLCREFNFDLKQTKYLTSILDEKATLTEFFKFAASNLAIKKFVQEYPHIIESYPLIMDQVKTESVHAAGVIIVPKEYNNRKMTIYDWMPVKKLDGVLVTEWEGPVLEDAGYLKEDILGTKQLTKISKILELIKNNKQEEIDLARIPLDDVNVFELFRGGNNEDVFQFGTSGFKAYCKELQPSVIDDLIASQALYRPGPMDSGIHKSYIKVKNGERLIEYDYMTEEITKDTYGFVIYQEQIMKAMQILGGFDPVEADNVRKALGKKDRPKLEGYKPLFLKGAEERGCDKFVAITIWNKYEAFAEYGFNKSHAAAYTITGYQCQWLKFHYPLEFWSVALNFADQKEISKRIAEMHKVSSVKVLPPDINQSTNTFQPDVDNNVIFWSIGSIKQIGEKTLDSIIKQRNENGKFFNFDDFINRVEKKNVNKRHIINLILSGCFDKIEKINSPSARFTLLKRYICDILSEDLPEDIADSDNNWKDHVWILKQKELTGFGYLEFERIYNSYIQPKIRRKVSLIDPTIFHENEGVLGADKCVIGVLTEVIICPSKKGPYARLIINCNDENIGCVVWNEVYEIYKNTLANGKNKIIAITGDVKCYNNINQLQSNTQTTQIEVL